MMKWLVIAGIVMAMYMAFMMQTTNLVLNQTKQLQNVYQNVAAQADKIDNEDGQ